MLRSLTNNVTLCSAEEDACSHTHRFVVWVVHERVQFASPRKRGISHSRQQFAHVSVNDFVIAVHRAVIALVAVSEIEQIKLVQIVLCEGCFKRSPRITIRSVRGGSEFNFFSSNKVLDYVSAAVLERLLHRHVSGTDKQVNLRRDGKLPRRSSMLAQS